MSVTWLGRTESEIAGWASRRGFDCGGCVAPGRPEGAGTTARGACDELPFEPGRVGFANGAHRWSHTCRRAGERSGLRATPPLLLDGLSVDISLGFEKLEAVVRAALKAD
jgi:hypothetical protein